VWCYLYSLDVDYDKELSCPHHGTFCCSRILQCDGTCRGCPKRFDKQPLNSLHERNVLVGTVGRGIEPSALSFRNMMIYAVSILKTVRNLAYPFAKNAIKVTAELMEKYYENLNEDRNKNAGISQFLKNIKTTIDGGVYTYDSTKFQPYIDFALDLISDTQVPNGMILNPKLMVEKLRELITDDDAIISNIIGIKFHLMQFFPSLHLFIKNSGIKKIKDANGLKKIIKICIEACDRYLGIINRHGEDSDVVDSTNPNIPMQPRVLSPDVELSMGSFFSGTNGIERPFKEKYVNPIRDPNGGEINCNKREGGPLSDMYPGMMTWMCSCKIFLGWQLMKIHESVETVFTHTYKNLHNIEKGRVLIYDNCCTFQKYVEKREPWLYRFWLLVVDSFHGQGHTCGAGKNKSSIPLLAKVNSSASEQGNNDLRRMDTQIAFMTVRHYGLYVRFMMMSLNRRRKATIIKEIGYRNGANIWSQRFKDLEMIKKLYLNGEDDRVGDCECIFCEQIKTVV